MSIALEGVSEFGKILVAGDPIHSLLGFKQAKSEPSCSLLGVMPAHAQRNLAWRLGCEGRARGFGVPRDFRIPPVPVAATALGRPCRDDPQRRSFLLSKSDAWGPLNYRFSSSRTVFLISLKCRLHYRALQPEGITGIGQCGVIHLLSPYGVHHVRFGATLRCTRRRDGRHFGCWQTAFSF